MKKIITFFCTVLLVLSMTACSGGALQAAATAGTIVEQETTPSVDTSAAVSEVQASGSIASATAGDSAAIVSVAAALAENQDLHEEASDYTWDASSVVAISLNGNSIAVAGDGVQVDGSVATITAAGTYTLSGSLTDGQIIVNTQSEEVVRLILNGVDLHSASSAAIYIANAEKVVLVLAEGTQNTVSDGESYVFASAEEDEPNAAIFSKADLTIYGEGALTVTGNYNDGIASKDGLIIASGVITVSAVDDGVRGKDYLVVEGGNLTVTAQGDGLKSDNDEDASRGFITVEAGVLAITAGGDAITAQTDVLISDGVFTLTSGGGSQGYDNESISAKGIKGGVSVKIDAGTFTINASDDAIHSNGSITINSGEFAIATGDDGVHADVSLEINDGVIQISESYEGLESALIIINAGEIQVYASDDGINVSGGNDGSGTMMAPGRGAGSQDAFSYTGDYYLYIHGGTILVTAAGDGLDVNGAIEMTGGVVLVNGPTEQMNGALDYDGTFNLNDGYFVAVGSAGMAMAPGAISLQNSILLYFSSMQAAGTLVHIQDSAGEEILTFAPSKAYQSIVFSSPELVTGETYTVYTGGSASSASSSGLVQDGSYSAGSQYTSFTISSVVTGIGSGGGFGGGGGRPRP